MYPNSAEKNLSASLRHSINLPKPERKINVRANFDAENSIVEKALDNRWQISISGRRPHSA
jgi:inactivated superfamily I helicase